MKQSRLLLAQRLAFLELLILAPTAFGQQVSAPVAAATKSVVQGNFEIIKDIEVGWSGTRMMHLDMILPAHPPSRPMPAVFVMHAGGWLDGSYHNSFGRGNLYSQGFAVVSIEYHAANKDARWPVQLQDCLHAIRWVRANASKYDIDPSHFAACGESAGAHLAACVAVYGDDPAFAAKSDHPEVSAGVQAVVLGDAPLDILTSETNHTNPKYKWNIENLLGGTPAQNPEAWYEACMVSHVSKSLPPFFIWHGDKDNVVPIDESVRFVDALNKTGVPVEYIPVKNGGHDAFTPMDKALPIEPDGKTLVEKMTQFLERHLK